MRRSCSRRKSQMVCLLFKHPSPLHSRAYGKKVHTGLYFGDIYPIHLKKLRRRLIQDFYHGIQLFSRHKDYFGEIIIDFLT